jgi:NADH:ubiquinone oxidoreductase subunit 4 (subunit M)
MVGTFLRNWLAAAFAVTGIVLGALYLLWTYERVMFGPITHAVNSTIRDLTGREIAVMAPLLVLMLFMGLYPAPLISRIEPSVEKMLGPVRIEQVQLETKRREHVASVRHSTTQSDPRVALQTASSK